MQHTVSLKENRQFRRLYAKGTSAVTGPLVIYCRKNGTKRNRLGITVSAKMGNAVVRNRLRRRLKEAYRIDELSFLPGFDIVVVGRARAIGCGFSELSRSLRKAAKKCNLLVQEGERAQ